MSDAVMRGDMLELAEQVARGLSKASVLNGRAFIRTPILFPSGSTVVVAIESEGGNRFRLSDLGQGEDEADLQGIGGIYRRQAKEVAELSGLMFDDHAFVLTRAGAGQLIGATMAIANAASRALDRAIQRAPRLRDNAVNRLVNRLTTIFPAEAVERDVEIRGASTHTWKVDAVVRIDDIQAVFEFVTEHPNSVAFAATKFHDFARMDDPPVRIAVVHRKEKLGAFLAVVSQAAKVIEDDATDGTYLRAAKAA